ncbi:MAG: hypothetical protein P1V51_14190 [Deltaproteobacteria bacterium]|nr:hypothetical protein [Deltaproteobacteria bacterium]
MESRRNGKRLFIGLVIVAALGAMVWSSFAPMAGGTTTLGGPVAQVDLAAFTEHVAAKIRAALPEHELKVKGEGALTLVVNEETEAQIFLDNLVAQCGADPEACEGFVDAHVAALVEQVKRAATGEVPPRPEQLRLTLKSDAYLAEVAARLAEVPEKAAENAPVTRAFGGTSSGLKVVLVVDLPESLRMATAGDLEALGMDAEFAFTLARQNLEAVDSIDPAKPEKLGMGTKALAPGGGPELWSLATEDSYGAARALLTARWEAIAAGMPGPLVAAFPHRDLILYTAQTATPGERDGSVEALKILAKGMYQTAPYGLSPELFVWAGKQWLPLSEAGPEGAPQAGAQAEKVD